MEERESAISFFIKYTLFALNFLFWVVGLIIMGIGSWALATKELERLKVATSALDYVFDISIIFIVFGFIVCFLSTLGCVGALRENVCLLKTFVALLVIATTVLLVSGITLLALNGAILGVVEDSLSKKWLKNYFDDPDLKDITDYVQESFECCGMGTEGYEEWDANNPYFHCSKDNLDQTLACAVPISCCLKSRRTTKEGLPNPFCGADVLSKSRPENQDLIYTSGCGQKVRAWMQQNIFIIGGIAIGLALIPVIQIMLALTLVRQIQEQMNRWIRRRPYYGYYARPGPAYL